MAAERAVAVVDIDGVVADVRHRRHHIDGGRRDWDRFFAAAGADPVHPEGIAIVTTLAAAHDVVFVTGRPAALRRVTQDWLAANALGGHEVLMRADGDRRPAARFKREVITALHRSRPIAVVVDDDPDVLATVAELGIATYLATWEET